ncbi:hypothetical protein JCM10914_125 [Paenibacillus sp. JCM 10914]|nr:hypothetical protein JCM10914_125 [Paenibacillus sp. JCM 10914]
MLAASKNIGVTHITNGCYRLHPVEWNIGEAAGYCISYCLEQNILPTDIRNHQDTLANFQQRLVQEGIELAWPELRPV